MNNVDIFQNNYRYLLIFLDVFLDFQFTNAFVDNAEFFEQCLLSVKFEQENGYKFGIFQY